MSDKIPVAIYRAKDDTDLSELADYLSLNRYIEQRITVSDSIWNIHLYYQKGLAHIKWKDFIRPIVDPTEDVVSNDSQLTESIVLILEKVDYSSIYCVIAGNAYFTLAEYLDPDFGISILSRIIKKDAKVLKSTKEASLSGGIFGEVKFFRQNYNIFENESFGSFYQELKT
jgi:hypothetical protein